MRTILHYPDPRLREKARKIEAPAVELLEALLGPSVLAGEKPSIASMP